MTVLTVDAFLNSLLSIFDIQEEVPTAVQQQPLKNCKGKHYEYKTLISINSNLDGTDQDVDTNSTVSLTTCSEHLMYSKKSLAECRSFGSSNSLIGLEHMMRKRKSECSLTSNVVHIEEPFVGRTIESVYDGVHTGRILGTGSSGVVRLVTHRSTGIKYAVKYLDLHLLDS